MEIQGYFTRKGLALSAKLLTGATLRITRVLAGGGQTAETASALSQVRQTLSVNTPARSGNTATIPATLTGASAEEDYTLTELGVYARDPDEGEILYKIYRLDAPVEITAGSRMVLRFYLEETVSQDLGVTVECSPAGLVTEKEFRPVREKLLAAFTPVRSVILDAAELPAYLEGLPRLLTENLTLNVSGTLTEPLNISGFYGSGFLRIQAASQGNCTIRNKVTLAQCTCPLLLANLVLETPEDWMDRDNLLYINRCDGAELYNCTFAGSGGRAVCAENNSRLVLNECSISGFAMAVLMGTGAVAAVNCAAAGDFHDNTVGAYVWNGGTVLLGGDTPDLLGGSANQKSGGIIVKKNGTLL